MESSAAPDEANVRAKLQSALTHLNRGETLQAESILAPLMSGGAADADALQLMGLTRRMQDRLDEAEQYYRRSLALRPEQPQVHHNLGTLLRQQGHLDESVAAQRDAIRLRPNYAEAHLGLALSLSALGLHAEAEKSCRTALRLQPNYILAKQALAAELNDLERPVEAERILRQTLELGVRDTTQAAALEHNLGVSLNRQRRYPEALRYLEAAHEKVPDLPLVDYSRGNTLQYLGRYDEAVACYQRALVQNPLNMLAHRDLNQLLYRMGDYDRFLASFDEVAALYPEVGELPLLKADFLMLQEKYESAREAFERASILHPELALPHQGLGVVLAQLGRFEEAVREHEISLRIEPRNATTWRNYAETLLRTGSADEALRAAKEALAIEPQSQNALAIWTTVLRLLGDAQEERINDYDHFVRVYEIAPPPGYATIEAFNQDLNAYLDHLHRDKRESINQTLRRGTQTLGNLFGADHKPAELLRAQIDKAVTDYIAQMQEEGDHPLFMRRRNCFEYAASWSSRLHDCGFHTNHVHPKGWISSAYYVALPDAVERPGGSEGWIKFGEPNFECGLKQPIRRMERPVPGLLVLFPSYMWHGTIPFSSTQTRTTIAFDVVPQES